MAGRNPKLTIKVVKYKICWLPFFDWAWNMPDVHARHDLIVISLFMAGKCVLKSIQAQLIGPPEFGLACDKQQQEQNCTGLYQFYIVFTDWMARTRIICPRLRQHGGRQRAGNGRPSLRHHRICAARLDRRVYDHAHLHSKIHFNLLLSFQTMVSSAKG